MILGVVVQYVDGNQRIVHVNELFSSGEDDNSLICCVYGNCSCSSLNHALANLTSNVLINITTDATLSSLVTVSNLEKISIIGHNNPTVNCSGDVSEMQFTFSRHLIIQGITWIGCGTDNINHTKPGLSLSYSSNVTIQNCTFQQSVGQAIVLSEMSGDVNINNCKFVNNRHYRGHGAAIHYSSSTNNTINYSQFDLTIKNCNFSCNRMKSLVYLENKCNKIILSNSTFCYNRGISLYAINHKIYLNGKIWFKNNTADNGAGIYISDHSTVTFVNNSEVTFTQNSANYKGGAVFLRNHSSIIFDQNSVVAFINNGATNGTVYSDAWSNVIFTAACHVTFIGNSATDYGAAVYSDNSLVTFTGNSNVTFSSNHASNDERTIMADAYGGIIYSINFSNISFEGSSTTLFINNDATNGGAIYFSDYSSISFEGSSNTILSNNKVASGGGSIYHKNFGSISFKGNANTTFSNNIAIFGGAIELGNCRISHERNSTTVFDNNNANRGGAINSINSSITFEGISTTVYNNNTAHIAGAVQSYLGTISFNRNSTVVFSDNMAKYDGGAVYSYGDISFNGNSNVLFSDNIAGDVFSNDGSPVFSAYGGAVYSNGDISFNGNSNTEFKDNTAASDGGAVYSDGDISFNGNSNTEFKDNTAASDGGAVYSDGDISFNGNSNTEFKDNTAASDGGAVYSIL